MGLTLDLDSLAELPADAPRDRRGGGGALTLEAGCRRTWFGSAEPLRDAIGESGGLVDSGAGAICHIFRASGVHSSGAVGS